MRRLHHLLIALDQLFDVSKWNVYDVRVVQRFIKCSTKCMGLLHWDSTTIPMDRRLL